MSIIQNATYQTQDQSVVEYGTDVLTNINYFGVTEDFSKIEHFNIGEGRYLQQTDFDQGANSIIIGNTIAEKMFSTPERAIGKVGTFEKWQITGNRYRCD